MTGHKDPANCDEAACDWELQVRRQPCEMTYPECRDTNADEYVARAPWSGALRLDRTDDSHRAAGRSVDPQIRSAGKIPDCNENQHQSHQPNDPAWHRVPR